MKPWEDVKSPEEGQVPSWDMKGLTAKRTRTCDVVVQVKGNPMVKEAPTKKTYLLIEQSETKLHMIARNNTSSVPYCDSFQVLEEIIFISPDPAS